MTWHIKLTSSIIELASALQPTRQELRARLLSERAAFAESPDALLARESLGQHLLTVVTRLEPPLPCTLLAGLQRI